MSKKDNAVRSRHVRSGLLIVRRKGLSGRSKIDELMDNIEQRPIGLGGKEMRSSFTGEKIMAALMDFGKGDCASEYRQCKDMGALMDNVTALFDHRKEKE